MWQQFKIKGQDRCWSVCFALPRSGFQWNLMEPTFGVHDQSMVAGLCHFYLRQKQTSTQTNLNHKKTRH